MMSDKMIVNSEYLFGNCLSSHCPVKTPAKTVATI